MVKRLHIIPIKFKLGNHPNHIIARSNNINLKVYPIPHHLQYHGEINIINLLVYHSALSFKIKS